MNIYPLHCCNPTHYKLRVQLICVHKLPASDNLCKACSPSRGRCRLLIEGGGGCGGRPDSPLALRGEWKQELAKPVITSILLGVYFCARIWIGKISNCLIVFCSIYLHANIVHVHQNSLSLAQASTISSMLNNTYFLSTAISFSMLLSFPLRAFFGMHLTAYIFPVALSWARTTSEKAPLRKNQRKKNTLHLQMEICTVDVMLWL